MVYPERMLKGQEWVKRVVGRESDVSENNMKRNSSLNNQWIIIEEWVID